MSQSAAMVAMGAMVALVLVALVAFVVRFSHRHGSNADVHSRSTTATVAAASFARDDVICGAVGRGRRRAAFQCSRRWCRASGGRLDNANNVHNTRTAAAACTSRTRGYESVGRQHGARVQPLNIILCCYDYILLCAARVYVHRTTDRDARTVHADHRRGGGYGGKKKLRVN